MCTKYLDSQIDGVQDFISAWTSIQADKNMYGSISNLKWHSINISFFFVCIQQNMHGSAVHLERRHALVNLGTPAGE